MQTSSHSPLTPKQLAGRLAASRRPRHGVTTYRTSRPIPAPQIPPEYPQDLLKLKEAGAAVGRNAEWLRSRLKFRELDGYRIGRRSTLFVSMAQVTALHREAAKAEAEFAAKKAQAAKQDTPAPCVGCPRLTECKAKLLACAAQAAYYDGQPWDNLVRRPSAWRWRQIRGIRPQEQPWV